ncbi:MAG: hypothetical protein GVY26_20195 [Bacteroidetes bacterium]|jgi:hypothetical protein|nr:hypothetical protein [Bacteroidota bacterium]
MRALLLFTILISTTTIVGAQDLIELKEERQGFALKAYASTFILGSDRHSRLIHASALPFGGPSLAVSLASNRLVHELEVAYWSWEEEDREQRRTSKEYGLRYELGTYLQKPLAEGLWLRLGGGLLFYRGVEDTAPKTPSDYPRWGRSTGVAATFIPHLEWLLNEHWFIDLSLSFGSVRFSVEEHRVDRPDLPPRQREFSNYNMILGGVRQLRLGLGYKL